MGCASAKSVQVHSSDSVTTEGWKAAFSRKNTSLDDANVDLNGHHGNPPKATTSGDLEHIPGFASRIAPQTILGEEEYKRAGNKIFVTHKPALMNAAQHQRNATICQAQSTLPLGKRLPPSHSPYAKVEPISACPEVGQKIVAPQASQLEVEAEEHRHVREAAAKAEEEHLAREAAEKEKAAVAKRCEDERLARTAARRAEEESVARLIAVGKAQAAKAEEERLAREAAEAARRAEEERLAHEAAEAARRAEEERLAREAAEAARLAEEERLAREAAEAARQAEAERLAREAAEAARRAEEEERLAREAAEAARRAEEEERLAREAAEAARRAEEERLAREAAEAARRAEEERFASIWIEKMEDQCGVCMDARCFEEEQCPICMDDDVEGKLTLECGHVAHNACLEAMISARWAGKRITFNYMNCFICRQQLQHPELVSILAPHNDLRSKVMSICLSTCKKDELIDNLDALMEESPEQAEAAVSAEIACFECSKCKEPYAAGRVDCGVEEGIDVSTLQCADCQWKSPSEYKCSKHGLDEAVIKCDWCCNIATFKCGPGMFCNECHQPPYAHTLPLHNPNGDEARRVGQGQHCPGPDKCPLGMPHPPNGTGHRAFVVGCLHGCCQC